MSPFEEALKVSLHGLGDAFKAADADLHQEVLAAIQSIERVTQDRVTLEIVPVRDRIPRGAYNLVLRPTSTRRRSQIAVIARFLISPQGYPVYGTEGDPIFDLPTIHATWTPLKDREAIARFLASLAANPDSHLVQQLAYFLQPVDAGVSATSS